MSRNKNPVLSEKHLKALALIEKGGLSLDSVAKTVGWKSNYLYYLYEGDTSHGGAVASLFAAECRKIDKKQTQRIKNLSKANKELANELIHTILKRIESKKNPTSEENKLVGTLMNALSKATPHVSIGSVSYSYTKGYTAEQLVHEFRRFKTLTGSSSNRGAVQGPSKGRARQLPDSSGAGSDPEEEL